MADIEMGQGPNARLDSQNSINDNAALIEFAND